MIIYQASFFVLSYSLPLALIVALYSVMLHTLWNKVLENTNTLRYLKHNQKKFFKTRKIIFPKT